jgi:GDP-D-mannose 3', 5'-epimerase
MKRAAVLGGSGAIGTHLCARLFLEGYDVTVYDRQMPQHGWQPATRYHMCDLRDPSTFMLHFIAGKYDEVFQLAAEMGGAGFVFTGANDADILSSSVRINLNCIDACRRGNVGRVFFASSACVYSSIETRQIYPNMKVLNDRPNKGCKETEGIDPDSDYGREKLFSEHLYDAFNRNYDLTVRVGRFHNCFGPFGTWTGGREKAPAALCRKIAELPREGGEIEVWGNGEQTRSFIYVDEAVEAVIRLMRSDYGLPVNIGSSESVTINQLARMIAQIAGKDVRLRHVDGPLGVNGRNSDNDLIEYVLGWKPTQPLRAGLIPTYAWIEKEVDKLRAAA